MNARPAGVEPADVGPGVAWAYEFDEQGRGHALPIDSPVDLMHGPRFVWLHLILANARSREWIGSQDALVPEARELILSQDSHPRIEWRGDALWGTLYDIQREFQSLGEDAADLRFVLTPKFLLTARRHPVFCAATARRQIDAGAEFGTTAALFESMLVAMADSIGEAAHRIGAQLDSIEDRVLSESFSDERGSLLKLRRAVSRQKPTRSCRFLRPPAPRAAQGRLSVAGLPGFGRPGASAGRLVPCGPPPAGRARAPPSGGNVRPTRFGDEPQPLCADSRPPSSPDSSG